MRSLRLQRHGASACAPAHAVGVDALFSAPPLSGHRNGRRAMLLCAPSPPHLLADGAQRCGSGAARALRCWAGRPSRGAHWGAGPDAPVQRQHGGGDAAHWPTSSRHGWCLLLLGGGQGAVILTCSHFSVAVNLVNPLGCFAAAACLACSVHLPLPLTHHRADPGRYWQQVAVDTSPPLVPSPIPVPS